MTKLRRGFTLIEVLIAVTLVDIALLAMVAASTTVLRRTADIRRRNAALQYAANRLQSLGTSPCVVQTGAAIPGHGIREFWSVELIDGGAAELRDSILFSVGGMERFTVLQTRLPC